MEVKQLSIWTLEEIDFYFPRMKTKSEIKAEQRKQVKEKLLERVVLSEEEKEKYSLPLIKEELINAINFHNQRCETKFLNSRQGMMDAITYHVDIFNPGIPQMLLTSLSQYSRKNQNELLISDIVVMYKSLYSVLEDDSIRGDNFKKFRKENNLSFFGYKQFLIMDEFFKNLS